MKIGSWERDPTLIARHVLLWHSSSQVVLDILKETFRCCSDGGVLIYGVGVV